MRVRILFAGLWINDGRCFVNHKPFRGSQRNNAKKKHVSTVYATVPWLAFLFFSPVVLLMKKK
jgi:hypothetical protein